MAVLLTNTKVYNALYALIVTVQTCLCFWDGVSYVVIDFHLTDSRYLHRIERYSEKVDKYGLAPKYTCL